MNNEEIKKYRNARPTIDSCIDDAVSSLLRLDPEYYNPRTIREICWQLAEDSIDAYVGNLELVVDGV